MTIAYVKDSLVDLRKEPTFLGLQRAKDPLQESQLLYGERVLIKEYKNEWAFIEACEQEKFLEGSCCGYPGWVKADSLIETNSKKMPNFINHALWSRVYLEPNDKSRQIMEVSFGTRLMGTEIKDRWVQLDLIDGSKGFIESRNVRPISSSKHKNWRNEIIDLGSKLIGAPYFWGGRSAYRADWAFPLTSVDCSALVQLLYLIQGMSLPRDAHDQFIYCDKIDLADLQIADLIFMVSESNPNRMGHVMIYAGGDELLESTAVSQSVRRFPLSERIGSGERGIYFGRVKI